MLLIAQYMLSKDISPFICLARFSIVPINMSEFFHYLLVLCKQPSFKQMSETVGDKRQITQFIAQ